MRNLHDMEVDRWRDRSAATLNHFGSIGDHTAGRFIVIPTGHVTPLVVIAAAGEDWDHVSVSAAGRTPTWSEMEAIKRLFFKDDETAMQLHVPPREHINRHNFTLHLWRPHRLAIPRPPEWMV